MNSTKVKKEFYRYIDIQLGSLDGDFAWPGRVEIMLEEFDMVSETPKGWWIMVSDHGAYGPLKRWVSKTSKKRFAYPTMEQAWASFQARKRMQIRIFETRLRQAQIAVEMPQPKYRKLSA